MQPDLQNHDALEQTVEGILTSQRFGVLTTDAGGQPYASLVAFAGARGLGGIIFVTGRDSRKFLNMRHNNRVAILVDSRERNQADLANAVAVTAIGSVRETLPRERAGLMPLFTTKHPSLERFASASENALMLMEVTEFNVASFDKTWHLRIAPGRS